MVRRLTPPPPAPAAGRLLDALRGGHSHYPADREAAERAEARFPGLREALAEETAFTLRFGQRAARAGISWLVQAGAASWLPGRNLHDAARQVNPAARVLYVNRDPELHRHATALLGAVPGCATALGDPLGLAGLPAIEALAAAGEPVAVAVPLVLSFASGGEAAGAVSALARCLPAGSLVALSVLIPAGGQAAGALAPARVARRTAADVAGWLGGMDVAPPGVADVRAVPGGGPCLPPRRGGWVAGAWARARG